MVRTNYERKLINQDENIKRLVNLKHVFNTIDVVKASNFLLLV